MNHLTKVRKTPNMEQAATGRTVLDSEGHGTSEETAGAPDPARQAKKRRGGVACGSEGRGGRDRCGTHQAGQRAATEGTTAAEVLNIVSEALEKYFRFAGDEDALDGCPEYFNFVAEAFVLRVRSNGLRLSVRKPRS